MKNNNDKTDLLEIIKFMPDVILDIRYATVNNITGKLLYSAPKAFLRKNALDALLGVYSEVEKLNLRLVIFDAYRPYSVQQELLKVCDSGEYVLSDSNHCRGIAIDVSLTNSNGHFLDMGTDYDDFSEKSHANSSDLNAEQVRNRGLLQKLMRERGFVQYPYEWWHYDFQPESRWQKINDETISAVSSTKQKSLKK